MNKVWDFLWPTLTSAGSSTQDGLINSMRETVDKADWTLSPVVALEEARRIFDAENERRRGADSKAGIYLAVVTALIPVLTSLLPNLWEDDIHVGLSNFSLLAFGVSVAYLARAGWYAFQTISVAVAITISPLDIARSWETASPEQELAKRLAQAAIANYSRVNEKITFIKMTHAYLLRSFICFIFLLVVQVAWPFAASILQWGYKLFHQDSIFTRFFTCFS